MNQTRKPTRAANVTLYESARQALSAAVKVHEVKDLLDGSAALVESLGVPPCRDPERDQGAGGNKCDLRDQLRL